MNVLLPTGTAVLEDEELENYLQAWLVAITGLPKEMVRPRWQPEPPNFPNFNVDWCAFGMTEQVAQAHAAEIAHPDSGTGYVETRNHEKLTCLASFYGPHAGKNALVFRDGMQLDQNREYLTLQGMGFVESGEVVTVPELVKERWLKRKDLRVILRRQIVREYAVPNIATAQGTLNNEHNTLNIH